MKERVSFTFDRETIDVIDKLVVDKRYRNRSHLVEKAILSLGEKELNSMGEKDE